MLIPIITLLIIAYLFYILFIRGAIWVPLFLAFGIYGGKTLISSYFPSSIHTIATFLSYNISYATFIAAIVAILALGILMEHTSK